MKKLAIVATIASLIATVGCGTGRHVQKGIVAYNAANYPGAMAIWQRLEPDQATMNDKGHVRYLVYRGMTHFRLGQRQMALHYLRQGNEAYKLGNPRWLPPYTVQEMNGALAQLQGTTAPPPPGPTPPPPAQPPAQPPAEGDTVTIQ
jgi:hypothetical protein